MFLGFDLSTQQLKCVVTDGPPGFSISWEEAVHFDSDLPHFGTNGGTISPGPDEVVSFPRMWIEAVDLALERLKARGFPFHRVVAIGGAAQQHASVFWSAAGIAALKKLDASQPLAAQLGKEAFALDYSPNWQDMSTTKYCRQLEAAVGGPARISDITGSVAYERFTGAQIAKVFAEKPAAFEATARISLASSFLCSLLLGAAAPTDHADAAGTNLMDLRARHWHNQLLDAACPGAGPHLAELLGEPAPVDAIVGKVAKYYVERYGFSEGDNPSTLAGLEVILPSPRPDAIVSLGTSDTLFLAMDAMPPAAETESSSDGGKLDWNASIFAHPTDPGRFMALLCFKNGSLVRERLRDQVAGGSWAEFDKVFDTSSSSLFSDPADPPARVVRFAAFFPESERYEPPNLGRAPAFAAAAGGSGLDVPALCYCRAACMRAACARALSGFAPRALAVVGGGARGAAMPRALADAFAADVAASAGVAEACALGGCVRAALAVDAGRSATAAAAAAPGEARSPVRPDPHRSAALQHWLLNDLPAFERDVAALVKTHSA
ncbi:hypothetical protein HK405_007332 [Cladochytrium tenue]|nr:hypothetical protein HK405_007332 [Cladochytrium tenue]